MNLMVLFSLFQTIFKRHKGRLLFLSLCLGIGASGLFSISLLINSLDYNIYKKAREFLAADLKISSSRPLSKEQELIIAEKMSSLFHRGDQIELVSMVQKAKATNPVPFLVSLKGVDESYPFYGQLKLQQGGGALDEGSCFVEKEIALQYQINKGDVLKIGSKDVLVSGIMDSMPDQAIGGSFGMAPKVVLPLNDLKKIGLVKFGSRVRYKYLFSFKVEPNDIQSELKRHKTVISDALNDSHLKIQTYQESQRITGEVLEKVSLLLTFISFLALLLSLITFIFSSLSFYFDEKDQMDLMYYLGFGYRDFYYIFSFLGLLIGSLSAIIGGGFGFAFYYMILLYVNKVVSDPIVSSVSFSSIIEMISFCMIIACLTQLFIVMSFKVSHKRKLKKVHFWQKLSLFGFPLFTLILILCFYLYLRTYDISQTLLLVSSFVVFVSLMFLSLYLIFFLLKPLTLIQNIYYPLQLAIKEVYRNRLHSFLYILSGSLGILLLWGVYLAEKGLSDRMSFQAEGDLPNLFLVDVQKDQKKGLHDIVKLYSDHKLNVSPMIMSRLKFVNDIPVKEFISTDSAFKNQRKNFLLTREFRLSYTDELNQSEKLTKGAFWKKDSKVVQISLEHDFANRMGFGIGDILTFDVLGRDIRAPITSIRKVNWASMLPNFWVLFPQQILENAPQFILGSIKIEDPEKLISFKQNLYKKYPNISLINVSGVFNKIKELFSYLNGIIRLLAAMCLFLGFIAMLGTLNIGLEQKESRRRILLDLGMKKNHVLLMSVFESISLGLILSVKFNLLGYLLWLGLEKLFAMEIKIDSVLLLVISLGLFIFPLIIDSLYRLINKRS